MIVESHQKGWKIINQRSHGLLAAMLAYQYDIDLPNEIMVPTLITIAEHDDGVAETLAIKNLTEAGAPRHFRVHDDSKKTDLKQYLNVMEMATSKCQLNALLTSLHINFIFGDTSDSEDKKLDTFLKEQEKNRKDILKHLDINKKYAERLYRFVQWCDAFSLLICMDKIQLEGRKMEIAKSPDGVMSQTFYKAKNEITVTPWVFKKDSFKVFYEYKIIEQLHFNSIQDFNEICERTPVQREEFLFSK
ncbi:Protein of unknown function [Flavobacterium fryxellicola]|uniref:DUF3891 domain-containing protein n=1 Tax=Flavobacterium fryxellicola TaxID=249352 RepID=A0A167UKV4_9FLAO|nr:DUF3891 family protein [Flavobacterium fryxellicola]OAB25672.1 hypothetical protein FBFR_14300 [Flavobacterium fryxellicola]SHN73943.1 Protein of unknown function [Flavobacterium fryxellicola]